ncbi:MAG: hypothetical protein NC307_11090 [Roseburia sp.]|nr:hypothetical protein [Roseburia sp.]
MKNKRIGKVILCLLAVCTMSGCGDKKTEHNGISQQAPEHMKEELEPYLNVDAEVAADQPEELYSYQATHVMPDGEKLKEAFMPEEECDTEYDAEFDRYNCRSKDGKKRASTVLGARFSDQEYSYYYVLTSTGDVDHMYPESFPDLPTQKELPFADKKKAAETVRETAQKLDIILDEEPFVFEGLDAECLSGLYEKELEVTGGERLQQVFPDFQVQPDMECYYMLWRVLAPHGERLRNGNRDAGGVLERNGAYVTAIYTSSGMVHFHANATFQYEEEQAVSQILSVDAALEQVKKQYENVILTEKDAITITEISLDYVPVLRNIEKKSYDILPAWCMYGRSGGGDFPFFVMVDAQTGEIL